MSFIKESPPESTHQHQLKRHPWNFKTGPFNHSGTHPSQGYKEFSSFLRPSKTAEYHVTLEKKGIRNRRR
ncbi:MAG TPA: hypothetical protein QF772_12440, partial [Nitrospinaceae bacterium]|nr:hypothetical protein [Nitrospinaceae bacterium]